MLYLCFFFTLLCCFAWFCFLFIGFFFFLFVRFCFVFFVCFFYCVFVLFLVFTMLPRSLVCPFLIDPRFSLTFTCAQRHMFWYRLNTFSKINLLFDIEKYKSILSLSHFIDF